MFLTSLLALTDPAPAERDPDYAPRITVTPRIGLGFPGVATAHQISTTKVGVGFVLHPEAMVSIGKVFEIGGYFHYSVRGITERGSAPTEGLKNHLVSLGAVTKAGFDIRKRSRLRIGLSFGYNFTKQGFLNDTFEGDILAHGFNIGASIDWSVALTRWLAFNTQLAMISQIAGRADLGLIGAVVEGGSKQKMTFPPLAFLAVGTEFGFGHR